MNTLRQRFSCFLVAAVPCLAQTGTHAPLAQLSPQAQQLSPKAAYADAMHPLELTRHAVANWSDTEVAALTVAMRQGKQECAAREATSFSGDVLLDLARLCALGQSFPAVVSAATLYLKADGPKPLLTQAYSLLVDAQLHNKNEPAALAAVQAMLAAVPYDTVVAESVNEALEYMQFVHSADALTLARARQPLLLARMKTTAATPAGADAASATEPPQSLHELYADGLQLPALEQMLRVPDAMATVAALDACLPAALAPDDAIPLAAARRRYALLGKPLQVSAVKTYLSMPNQMPALPAVRSLTALLVIEDWCAQCLRMVQQMPQTVFKVAGHEAYLYALLAETVPQRKPDPKIPAQGFDPAFAEAMLEETPTAVVSTALLQQMGVNDVPFLVLTDAQGIVRVAQPAGDGALTPGGTIDSAVARVGEVWPLPATALLPKPGDANARPPAPRQP